MELKSLKLEMIKPETTGIELDKDWKWRTSATDKLINTTLNPLLADQLTSTNELRIEKEKLL